MIHFFIGTKAQFIKMAPLMVEMQSRSIPFRYIDSGQHGEFTRGLRQVFGIREPDYSFSRDNRDITRITPAALWAFRLISYSLFKKQWLKQKVFKDGGICLVHGDTLSTLLGLKMAKAANLKVVHVEAGLRSFNLCHPFPEEIIRIYCMKHCHVLFAPSTEAYKNLQSMNIKGGIIKINGNTVVDALRIVKNVKIAINIPSEPYALAACHRMETITSKQRLEQIVSLLNHVSQEMKVVFVTHKPTNTYLERYGLKRKISPNVVIKEMLNYADFTALMSNSQMVLADGGSIQEECDYFDKPLLILRNKTERSDGIGTNAMLWGFDMKVLADFMKHAKSYQGNKERAWPHPSQEIVDYLVNSNLNA